MSELTAVGVTCWLFVFVIIAMLLQMGRRP